MASSTYGGLYSKSNGQQTIGGWNNYNRQQMTGGWNNNWSNGRRWARSVGAEETDVAQKDTEAADQFYTFWNGRWIPICSHQGRRWARGLRCDSSGVHQYGGRRLAAK